ncbi:MAG TPA: PTS sugar transporter subunit IIA [Rectinemataceae bacterium]|nr:PTS sugar transporter subunit IIA [Rectinemataceae bacterium]
MQVSIRVAARVLDVDEDRVYRMIKQNGLPAIRVGEDWRIDRAELLEWATGRGMKVSPDLFDASGNSGPPSLLESLLAGGILRGIPGEDAAAVLRAVVDRLSLPEDVDRDYLYEVIIAREDLGSTGIGEGIAIPHVRDPLVLTVARPIVTLCFLEKAVDFRAVDGLPVDVLFAIVCPTVKDHLHLLSRLGYALRDEGFRSAVRARASDGDLIAALGSVESKIGDSGGGKP